MMHCIKNGYWVALLLVGSAILLSSCEEKHAVERDSAYDAVMTEYSENRTIIASENGVKQYRFFAPLLEGYTAGKEPYREFRKGIRMVTFKKDSTDEVDVTLTSNYAIYYENRKLWEAKGNVVVKKFDGKELYTEQLFWNDLTNKIYSNVDSKIVEKDGVFFVSGFESDEEFRFWSAREMDGEMQMEFKPTRPDSTALAEEEQREKQPQKSAVRKPSQPSRPAGASASQKRLDKAPSTPPSPMHKPGMMPGESERKSQPGRKRRELPPEFQPSQMSNSDPDANPSVRPSDKLDRRPFLNRSVNAKEQRVPQTEAQTANAKPAPNAPK